MSSKKTRHTMKEMNEMHSQYNCSIGLLKFCVHVMQKSSPKTAPFSHLIFCNFVINLFISSLSSALSASLDISLIFSVKSSM